MLPFNIAEGDYIEIGQLGAYSRSIRTDFNGFNENEQISVSDEPLASMYKQINETIKLVSLSTSLFT
jgi:ornithine decarboxylase